MLQERVLVTGAGSGIGRRVSELLRERGSDLVLLDNSLDRLQETERRLQEVHPSSEGGQIILSECDVTDEIELIEAFRDGANHLGGFTGLINSAGIDHVASFTDTTKSDWQRVMDVNVVGTFLLCREFVKLAKETGEGGAIVNVSSTAGLRPAVHRSAYAASKAAVVMLTKTLAYEAADWDVRANVVCPGAIDTPMLNETLHKFGVRDEQALELLLRERGCVIARAGTVTEVASMILYLIGGDSSYITGAAIPIDGGRSM